VKLRRRKLPRPRARRVARARLSSGLPPALLGALTGRAVVGGEVELNAKSQLLLHCAWNTYRSQTDYMRDSLFVDE
jgi:hypothetical protein